MPGKQQLAEYRISGEKRKAIRDRDSKCQGKRNLLCVEPLTESTATDTSKKTLMAFERERCLQRRGWQIDSERSRRKQTVRKCNL